MRKRVQMQDIEDAFKIKRSACTYIDCYTKTSWKPQTKKSTIGKQSKHITKDRHQITREQKKRQKRPTKTNPKQLTKCP